MLYAVDEWTEECLNVISACFNTSGIVGSWVILDLKSELCWVLSDGLNQVIKNLSRGTRR